MNSSGIEALRARAVSHTMFGLGELESAVRRLGFVQADPIRSPARAQDLILRHRVTGYRAGELERRYPDLPIEEDVLYAYGFLPGEFARWLHPRRCEPLTPSEQELLARIRDRGPTHPGDLAPGARVRNAWGGFSKSTTAALDHLQYCGLLRVCRREAGIRVYEAVPPRGVADPPEEALRRLVHVVATVLAPVLEPTLRAIAARLARRLPGVVGHRDSLAVLLRTGALETGVYAGQPYCWPASWGPVEEPPRRVAFLSPFDPLVWDRRRFAHLWGWEYRFEAYTPVAKRVRGYYAMPVLWGSEVVGWANVSPSLEVELGFAAERPSDPAFSGEVDEEVERLGAFLKVAR